MKIAFYSPIKPPNHPVPSGDRLMARLLIRCLGLAGHDVQVASDFRAFLRDADEGATGAREREAQQEVRRLSALWRAGGAPDLWFCYHPYYKAPDLIGPALARDFGLAYVTAEASHSARRNDGPWRQSQAAVLDAVRMAAVNLCFTARDERGLAAAAPKARFVRLPAFIDAAPFLSVEPDPQPDALIAVAMMRPGDKLDSYLTLARSLALIADRSWTLDIVGDGPARAEVEAAFAGFAPGRIRWHGEKTTQEIAALLAKSSAYVWPGHGEAYGLAYLEAQAAGLPVVAEGVAGVPEVVMDGRTGFLTVPGDREAYAEAIRHLLENDEARGRMAAEARVFATEERSIERAAMRLAEILTAHISSAAVSSAPALAASELRPDAGDRR